MSHGAVLALGGVAAIVVTCLWWVPWVATSPLRTDAWQDDFERRLGDGSLGSPPSVKRVAIAEGVITPEREVVRIDAYRLTGRLLMMAGVSGAGVLMMAANRRLVRREREEKGHCVACGQDLASTDLQCPRCRRPSDRQRRGVAHSAPADAPGKPGG